MTPYKQERASLLSNRRREVLQLLESASEDYEKARTEQEQLPIIA